MNVHKNTNALYFISVRFNYTSLNLTVRLGRRNEKPIIVMIININRGLGTTKKKEKKNWNEEKNRIEGKIPLLW